MLQLAGALMILSACARTIKPLMPEAPALIQPQSAAANGTTIHMHRVESGESLYSIARHYHISLQALSAANALRDPSRLSVGMDLRVPVPSSVVLPPQVSEEEQLTAIEAAVHPELKQLRFACPNPWAGPPKTRSVSMIWPVDGVVISSFGTQDGVAHEGIDISAPLGTPIRSSADGKVIFVGERTGYGRLVVIEHSDKRVTVYAHNVENCVKDGDRVSQGEVIALVGQSGNAASPAVHFEIRVGQKAVNPYKQLPN